MRKEDVILFNCDIKDTLLSGEELDTEVYPIEKWYRVASNLVELAKSNRASKVLFSLNSTEKKEKFDKILKTLQDVFSKHNMTIKFTYQVCREGFYNVDENLEMIDDFVCFPPKYFMDKVDEMVEIKEQVDDKYNVVATYYADDTMKPNIANGNAESKMGRFHFLENEGDYVIRGSKYISTDKKSTDGLIDLIYYAANPILKCDLYQFSLEEEQKLREFIYECEIILKKIVEAFNIKNHTVTEQFYGAIETDRFYEILELLNLKERKMGTYSTKDILKVIWYLDSVTVLLAEPNNFDKFKYEIERPIIGCNLLNKEINRIDKPERYFEFEDGDRCSFILTLINEIHMSAYSLIDSIIVFVNQFYSPTYLDVDLRENYVINPEFIERLIKIHGTGIDTYDAEKLKDERNEIVRQYKYKKSA